MNRAHRWAWVGALALYVALAVVLTWPVARQFSTHVAGFSGRDSLQYTWSLWWSRQAWLQGLDPASAAYIYHPWQARNVLLGVAPTLDALALPLYALLTPTQVYNVLFLASLVLSGMSMYWLALDRTHSRQGALLAGAIFAFAAPRMGHALLGHLTHIAAWWLPLALLFGLRMLERPGPLAAILCGLFSGLGILVAPVVAAYTMAPGLAFVLGFEALRRRRHLRREHLGMLALAILVTALLTAPTYGPFVIEALREGQDLSAEGTALYSVDPALLVLPSPYHPVWGRLLQRLPLLRTEFPEANDLERIAYLGVLPLVLAIYGAFVDRRQRWPWLVTLLLALVLATGPTLVLAGRSTGIPMPYALLQRLPLFAWGRTPERFLQLASLAVAMLVGLAVVSLRLKPWATGGLLVVCVLGGLTLWPFPDGTAAPPEQLGTLARYEGVVLDLPISKRQIGNLALYYQTQHGRPIVGGYIHRDPSGQRAYVKALDEALLSQADGAARRMTGAERLGLLQGLDVRHLLVHRDHVKEADVAHAVDILTAALRVAPEDWHAVLVFEVPEATPVQEPLASFDDGAIELLSVAAHQTPGQLEVALQWRAQAMPERAWSVFVHLIDANGGRVGQSDSEPAGGNWPTTLWAPGTTIVDEHTLRFDGDLAGAILQVGLYDTMTGERLPAKPATLTVQQDAAVLPLMQ